MRGKNAGTTSTLVALSYEWHGIAPVFSYDLLALSPRRLSRNRDGPLAAMGPKTAISRWPRWVSSARVVSLSAQQVFVDKRRITLQVGRDEPRAAMGHKVTAMSRWPR